MSLFTLRSCGLAATLATLLACGSDDPRTPTPSEDPALPAPTATTPAPQPPAACASCDAPGVPAAKPGPLHVRFLGVGGFVIEHAGEAVLTAPLFTRPSMVAASTGLPVSSDAALVAAGMASSSPATIRAVLSGHAHYDHLLDVPEIMNLAPSATLYANRSARNLMAAYAPDRAARCAGTTPQTKNIARSRVVALDDPAASKVDYTNCPALRPAGAPLQGTWVDVPGAHVRILAVCSEHPDQIGPIHFGRGDVVEEECSPPTRMDSWREGKPLAYLVDFLDPRTAAPIYRVFYQDAPTNAPVGHVPPPFLAGKRVDIALMCVGTYDRVDHASPAPALAALTPRFALGGHWEDFFRGPNEPPQPIPFLDVAAWEQKARAALPFSTSETRPMMRNGVAADYRASLPQPGDTFEINTSP